MFKLTINEFCVNAYLAARERGFHDNIEFNVPQALCLIHSEVSEALEAYRANGMDNHTLNGKPEGFASELADVVIRIADLCGRLNIDLGSAIETKMAFNATRPYRHGKRF